MFLIYQSAPSICLSADVPPPPSTVDAISSSRREETMLQKYGSSYPMSESDTRGNEGELTLIASLGKGHYL